MPEWSGNDSPLAKRHKSDFFDGIIVLVGAEQRSFYLHKTIVVQSSDFFRAAFDNDWEAAIGQTIRLHDVEVETFGVYLGWLYTGRLQLTDDQSHSSMKYNESLTYEIIQELYRKQIQSYILGLRIQDDGFCNAITDEARALLTGVMSNPSRDNTNYVWRLLPKSKLAKFMVDAWMTYGGTPLREQQRGLEQSFLMEIAFVYDDERKLAYKQRRPFNRPQCFYHVHKEGSQPCKGAAVMIPRHAFFLHTHSQEMVDD